MFVDVIRRVHGHNRCRRGLRSRPAGAEEAECVPSLRTGFLLTDRGFSSKTPWRRGWDSNPRKVALHTLSKRADSAALAPLLVVLLHDIGG